MQIENCKGKVKNYDALLKGLEICFVHFGKKGFSSFYLVDSDFRLHGIDEFLRKHLFFPSSYSAAKNPSIRYPSSWIIAAG